MKDDLKKDFAHPKEPGHFIKVTDFPVSGLTSEQKVVLNRKGNVFFNQGKILEARRLFITTGYSDGLNRVAEKSMGEGKELDALKLYLLAHNKKNAEPLIEKLAGIISSIIKE
ncbi:MAG: hypothetical protein UIH41_11350 [Treponemataceae bacterium]|nr:hypothetical protein [Treponemataceae bacterium]